MKKFILFPILFIVICLGFSQSPSLSWQEILASYNSANSILKKAEQLANQADDDENLLEAADKLYLKALTDFRQVILNSKNAGYDSLLFFAKTKSAYISFSLSDNQSAKIDYLRAINLKTHLYAIEDSFLFLPLVYTGGIYYSENNFDSALYYFKEAEKIKDRYSTPLEASQRLYNRLGAMYYETGNFKQARNYFEKAISILNTGNNMDEGLLANYQINIASILVKSEEYEAAKLMFQKVLTTGIYNNEVYHNLAIINLKEEKYKEALQLIKKVNYSNSKKNIELIYNTGMCWAGLNHTDSANYYLEKAIIENEKWYGENKSIPSGLIYKYKGDIALKAEQYEAALTYFQQAIIQFDNSYLELDSTKNPQTFSGVFSFINLFNTLAAKADVFEKLYAREKKILQLQHALEAYQSAFKLADYVEKTYDTDEARLFLGKIKYTVHSRPIDVSLHLYQLVKDKKYLEAAWNFDQRNKASLLTLNLQENEWKNKLTNNSGLLQEELALKKNITRLVLKIQNTSDSAQLNELYSIIRDEEIELGKLQERINAIPEFKLVQQVRTIPGITSLQKELDVSSAILSYHLSENKILIFCLTAGAFNYEYIPLPEGLFSELSIFRNTLQSTIPGQPYNGITSSKEIFRILMKPILHHLSGIKNLIIIPDDELNYLPFDALQDENNQFLLQHFAIQYLSSASLFKKNISRINYSGVLGFAPFTSSNIKDDSGIVFKRLPYSREEIEDTKGKYFTDSLASKNNFLIHSNRYPVLHLATHAKVDNNNPDRSYIAFYPNSSDHLLYAPEIYNLDLDSTQLVILSACETGTGQLIKGEGLLSLSRAFSYAGCSNIIASLWSAEDKTTSFVTKQLYLYLNKGYSKAKALQKAKIDLLNNDEISPALKSPNYWGHLILIGDYETGTKSNYPIWLIMLVTLAIGGLLYFMQQKKSDKVSAS